MSGRKQFAKRLRKRGSPARIALAKSLKYVRGSDRGKGDLPYNLDRGLYDAPFGHFLKKALLERAREGSGKISVLDKGAGTGRMAADAKGIAAGRIKITALTLSKENIAAKNKAIIDSVRLVSGMLAKHAGQYDIIYDCYGEDYHLPRALVKQSILKSISLLRKGGEFFTVIPLLQWKSDYALTAKEGKQFVRGLAKRKNTIVKFFFLHKKFEKREYMDMIICIKRK